MPKNKIVMGVPAYAHTFTLQSADQHGMNAPVVGVGQVPAGNPGYAMYREMCDLVKNKGWIKAIPDDGGAHDPIAYSGVNWACYDDPFAANNKSMWVKENGYGGIHVWEITQDDFHPKCCKKAYPLLRAINHGLFNKTNWPYTYGCEPKTSST
ncbi:unnamed protein product [Oppiella nova]|uniref:GH18 domain-containing protein n=1 Tax=Oppiella nova TaxID=334625 RepID=A0A7R9QYD3_9ACAR|nr:unnamed protein product [Oppiella nova]CAG2178872.1 unnamed protein product [Oppiella nova]